MTEPVCLKSLFLSLCHPSYPPFVAIYFARQLIRRASLSDLINDNPSSLRVRGSNGERKRDSREEVGKKLRRSNPFQRSELKESVCSTRVIVKAHSYPSQ